MAGDTRNFRFLLAKCVFLCCISYAMCENEGLHVLADALGTLADMFGGSDDCTFRCQNGETPVVNRSHKPSSNGCGSYGIKVNPLHMPFVTECCNDHDYCYDTCNKERQECDRTFKSCLSDKCRHLKDHNDISWEKYEECQATANMLFTGTTALGCSAFLESQKNACVCPKQKQTEKRNARKRPQKGEF